MSRIILIILTLLFRAADLVSNPFVTVEDTHFMLEGQPYRFIGTNLWYGMHLGAPESGDQERLVRELDRLMSLGVSNLRVMACSEGPVDEPWRVIPVLYDRDYYNEDLCQGLDFLLYEMGRRDMKAVICLTNFWPWTGGMAQYVSWATSSDIPYPPPENGGSWLRYQLYTSRFYSNPEAMEAYRSHIRQMVTRRNSCTGVLYTEDPVIMAWEIANEPRAVLRPKKYRSWIKESARLIKKLDPNHLVTIGSEGNTSSRWSGNNFTIDHAIEEIDYCTIHFWAENWGWYDPRDISSLQKTMEQLDNYLNSHIQGALVIGKPLVLEEFGLARNEGAFDHSSEVTSRDDFFKHILNRYLSEMEHSSPFSGLNFWAWSGEGRPEKPGSF
ncbi:MAG: cellulase family glycosylhydrolase [Saprospiraceae bacterium]|nr:cellulase family glycosylhydrolase [Saprospiraceae bacterium]